MSSPDGYCRDKHLWQTRNNCRDLIWARDTIQSSPNSNFYCDSRWGASYLLCSWTQMSTFLLGLSNDGSVLFNFQSIWIMKEPDLQFLWCISFFLRGCRNSQKYFALWYAFLSPSLNTYFHFMMLMNKSLNLFTSYTSLFHLNPKHTTASFDSYLPPESQLWQVLKL